MSGVSSRYPVGHPNSGRVVARTDKCLRLEACHMSPPGREVEYTEADVIEIFKDRGDYAEPLTASEVADLLGCSRRTALNKLHDLEDRTDLTSKKVGGRSRVWWIPVRTS